MKFVHLSENSYSSYTHRGIMNRRFVKAPYPNYKDLDKFSTLIYNNQLRCLRKNLLIEFYLSLGAIVRDNEIVRIFRKYLLHVAPIIVATKIIKQYIGNVTMIKQRKVQYESSGKQHQWNNGIAYLMAYLYLQLSTQFE